MPPLCPNCDHPVGGNFCANCGQENASLRPTLRELGREVVEDWANLDAKIFRTLRVLLARPGALTLEYLAGRRARYLRPLRLYLTMSVLFFLAVRVPGAHPPLRLNIGADARPGGEVRPIAVAPISLRADALAEEGTAPADPGTGAAEALLERRAREYASMSAEARQAALAEGMARHLPNAAFVLVPVFAALLTLLHRRAGRVYLEHLALALHEHALAFAVLILMLASDAAWWRWPLSVWLAAHVFLSMRRVYGESAARTVVKFALLSASYLVLLGTVTLGIVVAVVLGA